ncbi:hypothetical protein ACSSJB_003019, partial [Enterococcus faecalis]
GFYSLFKTLQQNQLSKAKLGTRLQTNLLKQLSSMNQIDLFKLSLEESRQEETRFKKFKIGGIK